MEKIITWTDFITKCFDITPCIYAIRKELVLLLVSPGAMQEPNKLSCLQVPSYSLKYKTLLIFTGSILQ